MPRRRLRPGVRRQYIINAASSMSGGGFVFEPPDPDPEPVETFFVALAGQTTDVILLAGSATDKLLQSGR